MSGRISEGVTRGPRFNITIDGREVEVAEGETLAVALLAEGITTFNRTRSGKPRGPFCNMGTCFECQVRVATNAQSGFHWVRACACQVAPGMKVTTGSVLEGL